ncbi:unnamed protein product [Mytilus coruscus]|uniref:Uncharacterized protein n=1 Tax=Mytilus coruscus TaxID=42192 RepID=A0A6J8ASP7_MYTCO|nr:unnamed protein product [Mytilus coruscus]
MNGRIDFQLTDIQGGRVTESLPDSYAVVKPAVLKTNIPVIPVTDSACKGCTGDLQEAVQNEYRWLETVANSKKNDMEERTLVSWGAYHAEHESIKDFESCNKGDTTITSENSEVITELYYVNFNEVLDNTSLEEALKEFYQHFKYPLYKERKVSHDAEVYNMTHFTGSRVKRAFHSLSDFCNGEGMKTVYGVDSGSSCIRLKLCKGKEETLVDCGNEHITAPMIYQCL